MDKLLVDNALRLDDSDKLSLIEELYRSLDKPDPEVDEAWLNEAKKRLQAVREGKARLIPMSEVFGKYQ